MKTIIPAVLCVLALTFAPVQSASAAGEPEAGAIAADAVLGRPACFVATIVGTALFVVALPAAIPSKSVKKVARALVVKPAKATFTRPLGDFSALQD